MEELWDLLGSGRNVSVLCHELSLHCHCLNNDLKAPVSPVERLRADQGGSQSLSLGEGKGLSAAPDRVPAAWGRFGTQEHRMGPLCVPEGSQPWQCLAAVNAPEPESPPVAP